MFPIEIVNKILVYIGELNHDMVITQYHPNTFREYSVINFYADSLWRIKSVITMKRIYPVYLCDLYLQSKSFFELYHNGVPHYEKALRQDNSRK
jgi:hypothetical protein